MHKNAKIHKTQLSFLQTFEAKLYLILSHFATHTQWNVHLQWRQKHVQLYTTQMNMALAVITLIIVHITAVQKWIAHCKYSAVPGGLLSKFTISEKLCIWRWLGDANIKMF